MIRIVNVAALAACIALVGIASSARAGSKVINDEMIGKLDAEMQRNIEQLRVRGETKPYFFAYKLTEVEVNDVAATLGSTLSARERHFMNLDASVRVGDYSFDNSNFVVPRGESIDGLASIPLPLEATPKIAGRAAWLTMDAAYKEALAQYTAKKAATARRPAGASKADSYSREPTLVKMDPIEVPALEGKDALEGLAKDVSAVFRDKAHIRESHVAYTSFLERRWYFNSEGSRAHDVRRVSGVVVVATTRAADGEILTLYTTHYGHTLADLPKPAALKKQAAEMAATLDKMRNAPALGNYTGPVLFVDGGAAAMARHTLTQHLSGTPVPDGVSDAQTFGDAFSGRLGARVVAPILSVWDDPTATKSGKTAIIGGFQFDDEGVTARKVNIIVNGVLETLLMSRTPSASIKNSNGHARKQGPGMYHGSTTNLFVTGKKGKPRKALIKELIKEAKAQGLEYAVIVEQWDDPVVTATGELTPFELVDELQGRKAEDLPPVLLAHKVYVKDGRQELVRGVQLVGPVRPRAWRDVIAVGNKPYVTNYLATADDAILTRFRGGGTGFVPSAGVESSITTPDLLFRELDIRRTPASLIEAPVVPAP